MVFSKNTPCKRAVFGPYPLFIKKTLYYDALLIMNINLLLFLLTNSN